MRRPRPIKRLRQYLHWIGSLPLPGKIGMIIVTVFATTAAVLTPPAAYIAADATTRLFLSDEPSMVHFEGTGKADRTVMYVGGAGSSAVAQSASLVPALLAEGKNIYVAENAAELFTASKVINLIIRTIEGKKDVVFVAGSMGGMIVYDVIKLLRERGDTRHFGVVLIDTPGVSDDVIGVNGFWKAMSVLPLGAITNGWFHPPFDRNAPAVIDDDADRALLETLWRSYETWLASSWRDQGLYTFFHDLMEKLSGVTWYYIRSGADTFVGESAYTTWVDEQGSMPMETIPEGAHLALLNRPRLYNAAIIRGIHHVAKVAA